VYTRLEGLIRKKEQEEKEYKELSPMNGEQEWKGRDSHNLFAVTISSMAWKDSRSARQEYPMLSQRHEANTSHIKVTQSVMYGEPISIHLMNHVEVNDSVPKRHGKQMSAPA
jgi:CRISPR/Cas system CSM-associated protein Csm5 (group 7 of RAMP superfamily)